MIETGILFDTANTVSINIDFALQVKRLHRTKEITDRAFYLTNQLTTVECIPNTAIQLTKEYWLSVTKDHINNWEKEYTCLSTTGVWKEINNYFVISPSYIFNGSLFFQQKAIEAWIDNKPFNNLNVTALSRGSNKHRLNK